MGAWLALNQLRCPMEILKFSHCYPDKLQIVNSRHKKHLPGSKFALNFNKCNWCYVNVNGQW
jgi:hypothetical protein